MISWFKKRGESPLRALTRLREARPELAHETLSYAGRLDPMAEGVLPILVGTEENKNRREFLNKDKEYEAHFFLGCATDTHDVLGIVTRTNFKTVAEDDILKAVKSLLEITQQTYPWYSSKTVDGIPLFEYARKGKFNIVRPVRTVEVYGVEDIKITNADGPLIISQNMADVMNVSGDFRQEEIHNTWETVSKDVPHKVQIVCCKLRVSSGTYIRSMTENLEQQLEVPVVLQKLVRTRVF